MPKGGFLITIRLSYKNRMTDFWRTIKKPFFILAPMADVTDVVFRDFVSDHSRPDVLYTEFVACRGLLSPKGREHLLRNLLYTERQRPVVAQVFGAKPDDFFACAKFIRELGFDGMDINMGCPDRKVEKQGAGASLIRDPKRAREIIRAAKDGLGDVPLAVKTRLGYDSIETQSWIGALLEEKPDALIVHGRTRKEMSKVSAHWDEIALAARMAHEAGVVCVGNGDVESREQGMEYAEKFGVDGIMIGRGVFGNPWVFAASRHRSESEKLVALGRLAVQFGGFWRGSKNFNVLKKHFKAYMEGHPGSKELRTELMTASDENEVVRILGEYFHQKGWELPEIVYEPILPIPFSAEKKAFELPNAD